MTGFDKADDIELSHRADKLFHDGNFVEAFLIYKELARRGQVDCQRFVGARYISGPDVKKDPKEAEKWLRPAAESGDGESQYLLSLALELVEKSDEAMTWLKNAADNNFAPALVRLGTFFESGTLVGKDVDQSFLLYRDAHRQGHLFGSRFYALGLIRGNEGLLRRIVGMVLYCWSFPKGVFIAMRDASDKKLWL